MRPLSERKGQRPIGLAKGDFVVPDDFNDPLPEDVLESEQRWDDLFARSADLFARMADEAIREDDAGLTEPLDPERL